MGRGDGDDVRRFLAAVGEVTAAQRAGSSPADAWNRLGIRTEGGVPVGADLLRLCAQPGYVAAVRAAARLAVDVGAPTAALLERVAMAVGRDAEAAAGRRAALAGPRATARVLGWLPGVGLLLGVALGADPVAVLLDGGRGTVLLLVGAGLLGAGRWWSGAEVASAVRAGEQEA